MSDEPRHITATELEERYRNYKAPPEAQKAVQEFCEALMKPIAERMAQVLMDSMVYGTGVAKVNPDGTPARIDPEELYGDSPQMKALREAVTNSDDMANGVKG